MLKNILKNSTYLFSSNILSKIITVGEGIILVRYLGKHDLGVWGSARSLSGMLIVITAFGLEALMVREVSRDNKKLEEYFINILILKIFLSVLFLILIVSIANILQYPVEVRNLIYILSLGYIIHRMQGLFVALFRATQKFIYESALNLSDTLVFFLLVTIIVYFDYGLMSLAYGFFLSCMLHLIACFVYYFRHYTFKLNRIYEFKSYLDVLKRALPFAVFTIALPIFYQIDIVMLSKMSGFEATGIYTAAYKLIIAIMMIAKSFRAPLFPTLSALYVKSTERFKKTFIDSYRLMAMIGIPISFGVFLLADKIVLLLYGRQYSNSIWALRIMAFSLSFIFLHLMLSVSLNAGGGERQVATVLVLTTTFNIILNLILIPRFSYIGASIATLLSEMLRYFGNYYYFKKRFFNIKTFHLLWKIVTACIIMSLFIISSRKLVLPLSIAGSVSLYFLCAYWFRIVSREEIRKLLTVFR